MRKPIQISIPNPCHEDWNKMTPVDKGRFCDSCQKNVIDFSRSSDREIAEAVKKNKNLCGRFRSNQVGRDLFIPKEKNRFWTAASAAVMSFISLTGTGVWAHSAQVSQEQLDFPSQDGEVPPVGDPVKINGVLTDENGTAVEGAKIINKKTGKETLTDKEGKFEIYASVNDVIMVAKNGYFNLKITFTGNNLACIKITHIDKYTMINGGLG